MLDTGAVLTAFLHGVCARITKWHDCDFLSDRSYELCMTLYNEWSSVELSSWKALTHMVTEPCISWSPSFFEAGVEGQGQGCKLGVLWSDVMRRRLESGS